MPTKTFLIALQHPKKEITYSHRNAEISVSNHLTQILSGERFIAEVFLVFFFLQREFLARLVGGSHIEWTKRAMPSCKYGQSELFELHVCSGMFLKWVFHNLPLSCWLHYI